MKQYIGTKVINAKPMTKGAYNFLRGWKQPDNEHSVEKGYLVEYLDSGKPCHPDFDNYISWSPKNVFEEAYKQSGEISFGDAITYLKLGNKVARKGWNGKGMYLSYKPGYPEGVPINAVYAKVHNCKIGDIIKYMPYIEMKTANNCFIPWLASHSDMLANDWEIIK